jgi:hypothetical protein
MMFMPVVPLTAETSARFRERLGGIDSDTPRQWGSLSPAGLMAHLTVIFEFSLGESEGQDIGNALTRMRLMRWFIIHAMPWPRAKIKAPPAFTPEPEGTFEQERDRCLAALDRFVKARGENPDRIERSPLLGDMPLRHWSALHGRHLDHHMRQFGV